MAGALDGITIVELAGIGPGPFAGMMLADHGARVIRIDRPGTSGSGRMKSDATRRNREHLELDLKSPQSRGKILELVAEADGLIEGLRPGALERLGLGPDVLLQANPGIVIGRMTGWGQDGPLAHAAGHDINYVALSGALHAYGREGQKPTAPLNAVGDYGGGGMMLAFGMLAGILSARTTGKGQVVDCAMVDGAAILSTIIYSLLGNGLWNEERGKNMLDTGAGYYETYETADGKYISIGPVEPVFYAELLARLGISDDPVFKDQNDEDSWPAMKVRLTEIFLTKTRDVWCEMLEGTDVCFAPVLSLSEAPSHPHNVARGTFIESGGFSQPAPAPRFSATPAPEVRAPKT
ncbi:MAG: CoA transferase [Sphingomonadaceae bacterium]|nr:CoA transferase [Sphingomonadaceae bacterium]